MVGETGTVPRAEQADPAASGVTAQADTIVSDNVVLAHSPDSGTDQRKSNPARKAGLLLALMAVLLVGWYAVSDRLAPFSARGTVSAYVAQIAPRVAGQVTEVFVEDNTIVDAGMPLFQLDKRTFELAVRQGEAALAQAVQATDASAVAIASSQARVSKARANLENAQTAASRARSLVERGVVSQASLDDTESVLRVAIAEEEAAQADLQKRAVAAWTGWRGVQSSGSVCATAAGAGTPESAVFHRGCTDPRRGDQSATGHRAICGGGQPGDDLPRCARRLDHRRSARKPDRQCGARRCSRLAL